MSREKQEGFAAKQSADALARFKPALEQLARHNHTANSERYRIGQLYSEMMAATNLDYRTLDAYLVQEYGIQMPGESSMSRLRRVYETWCLHSGVEIDRISDFSPYLLYQIQLRTPITAKTAPMWITRLRTYSRAEVLEAADALADKRPKGDVPKFINVPVPEEVYELLRNAQAKFAESIGSQKLSHTQLVEFMSQLVLDSNPRSLKDLWAKLHGEEVERA